MSEEYFYDYFDSLDRDQFKAAIERESELLCEAGPGGGKTRTLVAKAVAECERRPVYIVTFTVSAADEIDQRIKSLLANSREYREVGKNWPGVRHVGTLHSWCLDWLRKNGCRQEVIDEKTVAEVAAEVNRRLRLKLARARATASTYSWRVTRRRWPRTAC
jgi:superfamily I DNA/RNA helicase